MKTLQRSTKLKILEAAMQILETSGIQKLTQPAVAKRVGIPQGQLTYHFKKRADLVIAVTEASLDRVAEYLWSKNPEFAGKGFDPLVQLTLEYLKSKSRIRALLGLLVEADETPEVKNQIHQQAEKVRTLIAKAFHLPEDSPEVTAAHANMIGYSIMFFLQDEKNKRTKLEKDFLYSSNILAKHIEQKRTKKKTAL